MQHTEDMIDTGSVIAAWLAPGTLGQLEPILRRLLAGEQLFVKQRDGSFRAKGMELGLARSFALDDLQLATVRADS